MDFTAQQRFFRGSQLRSATLGFLLAVNAAACLYFMREVTRREAVAFGLIIAALAVSLCYTPNYLHLTANRTKRPRWEIKIRWRIIGAALIIGPLCVSTRRGLTVVVLSILWLTGTNLAAKWLPPRTSFAAYFGATDFALIVVLLLEAQCRPIVGMALLAASAHLSLLLSERHLRRSAAIIALCSWLLILLPNMRKGTDLKSAVAAALLLLSPYGTAWLVHRAERHNATNIEAAIRELADFTGYSADQICRLWSTSDRQLAENWKSAAIPPDDPQRLTAWYGENSELYLFAISAYNLDYKRIRSSLHVLRFARGTCLDYGAGDGELILELARRGHAAIYHDVQGTTMKFARRRALRQNVDVQFAGSKEQLEEIARERGFDTVFALDVLEHIPDLPGELGFLCSLLSPGGQLVFDVPAGSTKSHPMHLDHDLDVGAFLRAKGLRESRTLFQTLPFRKQEKYVFRAPEVRWQ